jgi:hypothetical protein
MEYYIGLDVSLKQTSICVVDQAGLVVREGARVGRSHRCASLKRSHLYTLLELNRQRLASSCIHQPATDGCCD